MTVTRDDVVREALALVDVEGLDRLTLRALATRLGISAPTLYWHVRDKRHLLDLVAERILRRASEERGAPQPGQDVVEWLAADIRRRRVVLLEHRDSARIVAGNRPSGSSLPQIEQSVRLLVEAGLGPTEALRVLTALGSLLIGEVLEAQAVGGRPDDTARPPLGPLLTQALTSIGGEDERFEQGLGLMMEGLRARLSAAATPT